MPNPFNGSRRGKRGTSSLRPSRKGSDYEPEHEESAAGVIAKGKKGYTPAIFACFQGETTKDHLIPRQSLSSKQHLGKFDQTLEFERLGVTRRLQKDAKTGEWVETTDPRYRLAWKSDRTLLRQGKPDNWGEGKGTRFKRETARTKERIPELEIKETQIDPEAPTTFGGMSASDTDDFLETI